MPYFQRKPIKGLLDADRVPAPIPGLPSRGPAPLGAAARCQWQRVREQRVPLSEMTTGDQSVSPLSGMPAGAQPVSPWKSAVGMVEPAAATLPLAGIPGLEPPFGALEVMVEPAPVLSALGPVAPGGTAHLVISLVNEDTQPARIALFSTELIGENGARLGVDRISFQPRELTLSPGLTGEVIARVAVPANTPCGVYSGLIRASQLSHLHAVLVVQVETP